MANKAINRRRWGFLGLLVTSVVLSLLLNPKIENVEQEELMKISVLLQRIDLPPGVSSSTHHGLQYDFYRQSCPQAESIVRSTMADIYSKNKNVSAALLRLLFHDCFIMGCDASVFLINGNGGSKSNTTERQAIPNRTLKGFDNIDMIKDELETACPGVVSCADTLALAARDGIVLADGPFYPVFTGRRDSTEYYFNEALADIPKPNDNVNKTLQLFATRGFNERETVSLLGGHNIGKISCEFIKDRLDNFSGTGQPDPSMASDFLNETRLNCQGSPVDISSGTEFDSHYYQNLLKGRGLLFSDQQLTADAETARVVANFASDKGTTFRREFARAMVKMSNLDALTGTQGQVRNKCSYTNGN